MEQDNKIYWVRGNTQPFLIPLEMEVMTPNEELVSEPYYPEEGAVVKVILEARFHKYEYTPTVNGNLLTFTDAGSLACGCYDVVVTVDNSNGSHLRSKWNHQLVVTDDNTRTLEEWDEFKELEVEARAAIFFFAKGDPFTYEDFTPEEIEGLKKPAYDAAAEVAVLEQNIEAAETLRVQAEQGRVDAESLRVSAEQGRVNAEGLRVTAEQGRADAESIRVSAEQGRSDAEALRVTAEQGRKDAESLRVSAEQGRALAEQGRVTEEGKRVTAEQGRKEAEALRVSAEAQRGQAETLRGQAETARAQAEDARVLAEQGRVNAENARVLAEDGRVIAEGERDAAETQRSSTFSGYEQRIETMEGKVSAMELSVASLDASKLDKITEEQFNEIFN